MEYTRLGRTGLKVSRLCLGCMTFGREIDEAASLPIIQRALDEGVNFFDTANVYGNGASEEIVGRALKGVRQSIVLASKVYGQAGPGVNDRGLSRYHIMRAVEDSLRRLQTDHIDLYQVHRWDAETRTFAHAGGIVILTPAGVISQYYYGIEYEINPWMHKDQPTETALAVQQWRRLRDTYLELGHTVEQIDPIPGLP